MSRQGVTGESADVEIKTPSIHVPLRRVVGATVVELLGILRRRSGPERRSLHARLLAISLSLSLGVSPSVCM
jgi:hypothetical protein